MGVYLRGYSGRSGSVYSRHQFAFSVLKELAAHYNLTVMELLGYFYRTLANGLLTAYPAVRELVIALYLNAIDDSPAVYPFITRKI